MARPKKVVRRQENEDKKVLFVLESPQAQEVCIAGEFNNWTKPGERLERDMNGLWSKRLSLKTGRYAYKFFVDGQWQTDPNCCETVPDGFGGHNSVLEVG